MNKNIALFTGVLAFVVLFYKQEVALNLSIFCLLVWGLIFGITKGKYHSRTFWWLSTALFFTIGAFAWYGDFASFVALFFTLILFIVKAFFPKLNILAFPFVMIVSGASSLVRIFLFKNWLVFPKSNLTNIWKKAFAFVAVPIFFTVIFLVLYSYASERFASYLAIDWDFSNVLIIIALSALGFFFMFNFVHLYVPRFIVKENFRLSDHFSANERKGFEGPGAAGNNYFQRSGEITLVILNLILAFFIFVYSAGSLQKAPPTESYSSEVHERVYVLITSIVVAVAIIMIYFYSASSFGPKGRLLRALSYLWICLNAILVVIAVLKTSEYVGHYGLTFKRVGVYIFLMLSLVGLLVTAYKLLNRKTNIFLVNRMAWIVFVTMLIGFNVNWSWVVTKYNISFQRDPDMHYLQTLEYNKQLMYNTFGKYPANSSYGEPVSKKVQREKDRPILSRILYYQFLKID